MSARDVGRLPDPGVEEGESGGRGHGTADIIESRPEPDWVRRLPRPPRTTAIGFVLTVVVAAAAGYVVGTLGTATAVPDAPSSSAGPASPAAVEPIAGTGGRCAAQFGDLLQLGIEITNRSTMPLTVEQARARLPLRGLEPARSRRGTCGQLSSVADGRRDGVLSAGATAWLTIVFNVLVPCPDALPVGFTVHYTQAGRSGVVDLPGFSDLGDVPYTSTKCPS